MYRVFCSCFVAVIFAISALHAAPTAASSKSKDAAYLKSTPITYINSNAATEESDRHNLLLQHKHKNNVQHSSQYPIKRYDNHNDDHHLKARYHSQHMQHNHHHHQHHHHQHNVGDKMMHKSYDKKEFLSNAKLMNKLGLGKMRDINHHKKRLAHDSKYHARPDDSHMFVIKLPPNPYYYTNNMPIPSQNAIMDNKKIPVGFKSNGKPGRIYHWNIPVMKKMLGNTYARNPNYRHADDINELLDIKNIPTWPKDSEVADKNAIKEEIKNKLLKKKAATYYAPIKPKQINYFPGNGKPESLYIIEKSGKSLSPVPLIH